MTTGIGIDIGTFHTVATISTENGQVRPSRESIPSIALRAKTHTIVGVDAVLQIQLDIPGYELIQAPKLKATKDVHSDAYLRPILRKLVEQALENLGENSDELVLTVPPGWDINQCEFLKESVASLRIEAQFQHEPSALLIAVMHLALKHKVDPIVTAKLSSTDTVLVCDWGAGTVDVALVRIVRRNGQHEFACIGEFTEMHHGGINIAKDVICTCNPNVTPSKVESLVYMLQAYWQDDTSVSRYEGVNFRDYDEETQKRQETAAEVVAERTKSLFDALGIEDTSQMLCVFHGGPLESFFLRDFLEQQLSNIVDIQPDQILHVGDKFSTAVASQDVPWRRDVLVSAGASLFAAKGETLPEFEYEVLLKDSFGQVSSTARLAKSQNLAGIQVISPPYTGVDYYVEIQQVRRTSDTEFHFVNQEKTAIRTELALHVRAGGVIMYRISDAGVGYAQIEAIEAQDLPNPEPFTDARSAKVKLPERSTRFSINLG